MVEGLSGGNAAEVRGLTAEDAAEVEVHQLRCRGAAAAAAGGGRPRRAVQGYKLALKLSHSKLQVKLYLANFRALSFSIQKLEVESKIFGFPMFGIPNIWGTLQRTNDFAFWEFSISDTQQCKFDLLAKKNGARN